MKRKFLLLLACGPVLLAACLSPERSAAVSTPLPGAPMATVQPGSVGPTATPFLPPPPQQTGFFGLHVPGGWYHLPFEGDGLQAHIFTPLDPSTLEAFVDPVLAVPADFFVAALLRTPLPPGADPQSLQAGLDQAAANLTASDLESMLLGAGRIGLLETSELENVVLAGAQVATLGGRPSLAVHGQAAFSGGRQPSLDVLVRLAWTEEAFFTFYAIGSSAAWDGYAGSIEQALASINLP